MGSGAGHYNKNILLKNHEELEVGENVYCLNQRRKRTKRGSLKPRYNGPYKIIEVKSGGKYKLYDVDGKNITGYHSRNHLKKVIRMTEDDFILDIETQLQCVYLKNTLKYVYSRNTFKLCFATLYYN